MNITLQRFEREHYETLIGWVDSEEMLMQFAGPSLAFPLTAEQLDESLRDDCRIAFAITNTRISKEFYLQQTGHQTTINI